MSLCFYQLHRVKHLSLQNVSLDSQVTGASLSSFVSQKTAFHRPGLHIASSASVDAWRRQCSVVRRKSQSLSGSQRDAFSCFVFSICDDLIESQSVSLSPK